ncbi:hypothetical protein B5E62_15250 [Lachnoclostridium sp. An118]|nr:hypothetical protein B5E62_15250 [Lachnoclostridium sp. An118]
MNRGGLETMIMNYYRHIDRNKVQFDFLTHRDGEKDYDGEIEKYGGRIYHLPPLNPFSKNYLNQLDQFFDQHREYKIVHSHLDCMSAYPLKAAKKYGVPVRIAHSHTTSQKKDIKYWIKLYSKRMIPEYATDLFACSENAGRWMFGKEKFIVIKNAIDTKKYIYNEDIARIKRKELGISERFVIGHVGSFNYPKNHEFLIDIFEKVWKKRRDSILMLVGIGELEEKIKEKVKKRNLNEAVLFLGLREDVPELLQAMDVFVFPSLYEGLGIAAIEAQVSGAPCLLSDKIPAECQVTNLVTTLSLNENAQIWGDSIIRLANEKKPRSNILLKQNIDINENAKWLQNFYIMQSAGSNRRFCGAKRTRCGASGLNLYLLKSADTL